MWQDIVLSVVGTGFMISLFPQLIDMRKGNSTMNWITCLFTAIGCGIIAIVDFTLTLYISCGISIMTAIIWAMFLYYSGFTTSISKFKQNCIKDIKRRMSSFI